MVTHLMESNARTHRSLGAAVPSLVFHGVLILVAIQATAHSALLRSPASVPVDVYYVPQTRAPEVTQTSDRHSTTPSSNAARAPRSTPASAPILPQLGFSTLPGEAPAPLIVSRNEFGGGVVSSAAAPSGVGNDERAFLLDQVDVQAEPLAGNPAPRYPEALRAGVIRGVVLAQFIVDTAGHVETGSFVALRSDNFLFTESVRAALAKARFRPAQVGGRSVRQLVKQSFSFVLE